MADCADRRRWSPAHRTRKAELRRFEWSALKSERPIKAQDHRFAIDHKMILPVLQSG
jgi:hypothetical protein